ncbi:MAG: hypothetical protein WBE26_01580 [Phycisphaerae bacterium]
MALYESLIRIRNLPELAAFKSMLDSELARETGMMVGLADEKAMWRAQGACRMIIKLKELIEDSKSVLGRSRPSNVVGGNFVSSNSP